MYDLDFEKPLRELEEDLASAREQFEKGNKEVNKETIQDLEEKIRKLKKDLYSNLTGWQKVQISRHPSRPYTLDYINNISEDFVELHGDRLCKDDKAIVGGLGMIDGQSVMFIGHQKGRNTKSRQYRNFGMANPEGYRKALRLMKTAEKFKKPVVTLIDTPGAAPGIEAEQRGQAEAIARNLKEMSMLRVPIICIVIGEGASGGALGIAVGDRVYMMEYTWYSVIAPESCSSILWRSWEYKETAAEALQLTSDQMQEHNLIDGIIQEPLGGAHNDPEEAYRIVKQEILSNLKELNKLKPDKRITKRIEKLSSIKGYETSS